MKKSSFKSLARLIIFIISISILSACSNTAIPGFPAGTYSGNNTIIARYEKDGQYIYHQDNVVVYIYIGNNQQVTGRVGGAVIEDCKIVRNRGWVGRKLNIKTDYLIIGKMSGSTFSKDTIIEKDISIPFNIESGGIKGSLFQTKTGQQFPMISSLKLKMQ